MPHHPFLPGFETAPGPNRALVRHSAGETRDHIRFPTRRFGNDDLDMAKRDLTAKRHIAAGLGDVVLGQLADPGQFSEANSGWRSFTQNAHAWVEGHMRHVRVPGLENTGRNSSEVKDALTSVAMQGVATDIAFLRALPEVLLGHEFTDPNAEIAQWARSSVGFIIEWAGLDRRVDKRLNWALASPKPSSVDTMYDSLRFNPKWFTTDDGSQRVGLDPARTDNLRDWEGRHPSWARLADNPAVKGQVPLFGCPDPHIPRLHQQLVDIAEASGLFEQSYLEARADHGHPEAWAALSGLRSVVTVGG